MAYKTQELFDQARGLIEEKELFFMEDVISLLPCSKSTFYLHFPGESDGLDELKEMMARNRVNIKVELRKKWRNSDNATLQLALMKLIADNDERKRLSQTFQDHTSEGKPVKIISLGHGIDPDETSA